MEIQGLYKELRSSEIQIGQAGGALGKDEFMKMLVTQMQNQDPMDPVNNTEMTAQLAQFSALEQMDNLNNQFENFQRSSTAAMSLLNAGNPVTMELNDGRVIEGVLEKVQWYDGDTQFVVDGVSYSNSNVTSLQAKVPAQTSAEAPEGV